MPKPAARRIISCADAADAEQAERPPVQALRLRVLLLVPLAGAQLGDVVGNAPIEREDQREAPAPPRRWRSCRDSSTRRCRASTPRPRRSCCSRRPARTISDSRPASSIGAVTFVPRTTSTSAPLDRDRLRQRVVLQVRLVDDLAAGGLQAVDAALLELVGDETFKEFQLPATSSSSHQVSCH